MYKSETITRPDGSKYVQCTMIITEKRGVWSQDQEQTARAIKSFGTSS